MPELRKDPITGRWVIIATERAKHPSDFIRQPVPPAAQGVCPFDYGNEHKTPPEILAYRNSGGRNEPGWRVRVVANKFPVLGIEGELNRQGEGMYDKMNGIGAHEVIIETPEHAATLVYNLKQGSSLNRCIFLPSSCCLSAAKSLISSFRPVRSRRPCFSC